MGRMPLSFGELVRTTGSKEAIMAANWKTTLSALVSACLIHFASQPATAKESITWMLSDYPPIGIAEGPRTDAGVGDLLVRLVAQHLPEIDHHYQRANLKRMTAELEAGHKVCVPGLIKTEERENSMHFTRVPMLVLTPLCLIVRKQDRSLFSKSEPVSLEAVIRNPTLKLGITNGISWGERIDAIINRHKEEKHLYLDRSSGLKRGLLLMVASKRLDYTIGYPWMIEYLAEELGLSGDFAMLKLKESTSPIIWHAACSKSEWGLARIKEIDAVLVQVRPTAVSFKTISGCWKRRSG